MAFALAFPPAVGHREWKIFLETAFPLHAAVCPLETYDHLWSVFLLPWREEEQWRVGLLTPLPSSFHFLTLHVFPGLVGIFLWVSCYHTSPTCFLLVPRVEKGHWNITHGYSGRKVWEMVSKSCGERTCELCMPKARGLKWETPCWPQFSLTSTAPPHWCSIPINPCVKLWAELTPSLPVIFYLLTTSNVTCFLHYKKPWAIFLKNSCPQPIWEHLLRTPYSF